MFEQLSYNSTLHTESVVQQILNGTFMSGSYSYNNSTKTYASTFVEAGKTRNISPIQLASKVLQEQGTKGNSGTINMDGGDGKTYYNHFNINAYGSTNAAIIANALATAKANNWDNPYSSIIGGSATISNGYINVGQDNNYYQKFNTINNKSLYWNQYMANVRALPSESYTTYASYLNSNLINGAFTFKIPVYNNMPSVTTLDTSGNSDNTLKSLSVSGCNLNPSFNSSATAYTCSVSSNTASVSVTAAQTSSLATIKYDSNVILSSNTTTTKVVVTAANGETKTYSITINKVDSSKESPNDIISYLGYNNSSNMISGISLGTNSANIIANVKNKFSLATITIKDKNGNNKTSGLVATGDKITITNNNQTVTYTSIIKGDANGDGKISISDYAKVKSHILGTSLMSNEYLKAADANGDGKISISDYAKIKSHILGTSKIN
jgi:beta-N-acetylglucosaminidase